MRTTLAITCALCGALAAPSRAQDEKAPDHGPVVHVFWEGSLTAATQRAGRLGRPVLVAVLKPSEKRSRRFLDEVYSAPAVRLLLREYVCVVACESAAPPIEHGPRKGKSSIFGTVTVAEHQAVFAAVRDRYLGDEGLFTPQHLFLDAQGHLIERCPKALRSEDFAALLVRLLDKTDPGWRVAPSTPPGGRAKGEQPGGAEAVPWAGLFDEDPRKRQRAVRALLRQKDKGVVLSMYQRLGDPETKVMILEGARGEGIGSWVAPLVLGALQDADPSVRAEAAVTAQAARSAELLEDLMEHHRKEKDHYAAREILRAVGACAAGEVKALNFLKDAARSRDDLVRANAFVALGVAGGHSNATASRVADILIKKGLRDRDSTVRSAAVWGLGEIRYKKAVPLIEKLLKRDGQKLRRLFYRDAIRRIEGKDPEGWAISRRVITGERIKR